MIVDACKRGCVDAQAELYQRFSGKMYAVCLRYCSCRELAEDRLHDGFMRAFSKINTFKGLGSFEGWLKRVIANVCVEALRKEKYRWESLDDNVLAEDMLLDESEPFLKHISIEQLLQIVGELPPAYRLVFNMFVLDGMSHKEIAEELNISEGGSKSNLSRARALLQKKLIKMSSTESGER